MRQELQKNVLFSEKTLLIRRGGVLTSIRSGDHGGRSVHQMFIKSTNFTIYGTTFIENPPS